MLFVILLLIWMFVLLSMMLYFFFICYNLNNLWCLEWMMLSLSNWCGFGNYEFVLFKVKDFWFVVQNSLFIVSLIIILIVVLGFVIVILVNWFFSGCGIVCVFLILLFFVMLVVNVVFWINMILDFVLGLQGLVVVGINEMIVGLQNFLVLGVFFFLWFEIDLILFCVI